jgi:hypothetical protein
MDLLITGRIPNQLGLAICLIKSKEQQVAIVKYRHTVRNKSLQS